MSGGDRKKRPPCLLYHLFHTWPLDRVRDYLRMCAHLASGPIPTPLLNDVTLDDDAFNRRVANIALRLTDADFECDNQLQLYRFLLAVMLTCNLHVRLFMCANTDVNFALKVPAPSHLLVTEAVPRLKHLMWLFTNSIAFDELTDELLNLNGPSLDLTVRDCVRFATAVPLESALLERWKQDEVVYNATDFSPGPTSLDRRLYDLPFLAQFAGLIYHYVFNVTNAGGGGDGRIL